MEEVAIPNLTNRLKLEEDDPVYCGTYSSIHKGTLDGELVVAIKAIRPLSVPLKTMRRKIERERVVWSRLKHKNIVPLYGYTDRNMFFGPFGALISPWYQYGDAEKFLYEHGRELTMDERKSLWHDVVAGVCYLHSQTPPIVHGDLKPGNILIDDHGIAKICDFGLVRILMKKDDHSGMTTTSPHRGTERYLPYELVVTQSAEQLTEASDVYSMGCVGLFFFFLQIPYAHRKDNSLGDIFRDIIDGVPPARRPAKRSTQSNQIWSILERCWHMDPSRRVSVSWVLGALHSGLMPSATTHVSSRRTSSHLQGLSSNGIGGALGTGINQGERGQSVPPYYQLKRNNDKSYPPHSGQPKRIPPTSAPTNIRNSHQYGNQSFHYHDQSFHLPATQHSYHSSTEMYADQDPEDYYSEHRSPMVDYSDPMQRTREDFLRMMAYSTLQRPPLKSGSTV